MFLQRKFAVFRTGQMAQPRRGGALPDADWSRVSPTIRDIIDNIQILLRARRGYDHLFKDFGLSPITGWHNVPEALERLKVELPETLTRYESRFTMTDLELDVADDGRKWMILSGWVRKDTSLLRVTFEAERRLIVRVDYQAVTLKE